LGGVGHCHDGHHASLDRIADDQIRRGWHAPGHVQGDHGDALFANLVHGWGNGTAHQCTCEYQHGRAGEAANGPDGGGELLFADEGNGVDGDALAANVVPVGLADRAQGYLADLGSAADDDDPLAVDPGEWIDPCGLAYRGDATEIADQLIGAGDV